MATLTPEGGKHPVTWYRSTTFAAFMVAATAFTCPGIFGALNGMGAGGGASPGVTNAANAIVFGVLAVFSLVAGVICNRITPKWTLLACWSLLESVFVFNGVLTERGYRSEPLATPRTPLASMSSTGISRIGFSCSAR